MTTFLLKLFGLSPTDASSIARWSITFNGVYPLYIFLAAIVLGALVFWMYRRTGEELSPFRKYLLATLRALFLFLILGLLLRPVLTLTFFSAVRPTLLVLFDTSASMSQIQDQRTAEEDLKRLAIARDILDPAKGLSQPLPASASFTQTTRMDLVKASFSNNRLGLLPALAKDYDLAAYTFDKSLAELSTFVPATQPAAPGRIPQAAFLNSIKAEGPLTAIGDAIRDVISRKRGQPLAGILLVSDGAANSGLQPLDAAGLAAQDKVPLYIYGVGITSPRDIIVSTIFAQEVAFAGDDLPVTVRVRSMGLANQTARLMVHLGQQKVEQDVTFSADGEQLVTVKLTPSEKGEYDIRAFMNPREDEVVKDNNAATQRIRVIDGKIKVLYVEQYPRWEFKYAQAVLTRDRRIDPKFVLLEGDRSIATGSSPYLPEPPKKKEDWFKYDVIILGDVDPKVFSPEQLDALHEYVSKFGGSLITIAGKRSNPDAYRRTVIEKMLPVELETLGVASAAANRPIRLELTPAGKSSGMLRLAERELESASRWAALPPIYWDNKVARAKPAAEVLLVDPDPTKSSRFGKMPVIASQQYGLGQVLYIGTDNFWRFRRNVGDRYHSLLWAQMIQRMALPHLLGASRRTQLTADQKTYASGGKVTILARLYTENFEPMKDDIVRGSYQDPASSAPPREVMLRMIPDRPGMYRGEFTAPTPGNYRFSVEHDKSTHLEIAVTDPKLELSETAMNRPLLEQMASRSGGAFFREEDLHTLPGKIAARKERLEWTSEVELWSSPFYFLLLIGLVTTEWIVRKLSQLK